MIEAVRKVDPAGNHQKNSLHLYELFPMMSSFFTFDQACNMVEKVPKMS